MSRNGRRWVPAVLVIALVAVLVILALGPAGTGKAEASGGKDTTADSSQGRPVDSILEPTGLTWTGLD